MVKTLPSNAEGAGSIPGQGAKIPHALWPKNQNIKHKPDRNKLKDLRTGSHHKKKKKLKNKTGASLGAQWLRIRLPMQGTRVRSLVWEDPTYCGATKPVRHNY